MASIRPKFCAAALAGLCVATQTSDASAINGATISRNNVFITVPPRLARRDGPNAQSLICPFSRLPTTPSIMSRLYSVAARSCAEIDEVGTRSVSATLPSSPLMIVQFVLSKYLVASLPAMVPVRDRRDRPPSGVAASGFNTCVPPPRGATFDARRLRSISALADTLRARAFALFAATASSGVGASPPPLSGSSPVWLGGAAAIAKDAGGKAGTWLECYSA